MPVNWGGNFIFPETALCRSTKPSGPQASLDSEKPWICTYLEIDPDGVTDGHGGEAVLLDGEVVVGSTTSVAYGHSVGKILAFAYLKPFAAAKDGTELQVVIAGEARAARVRHQPAYDPKSLLPRTDAAQLEQA